MNDNISRITSRVRELILNFFPPDTPNHVIQNYQSYFLRILSSRISIPSIEDESTVREALQKRLYKQAEEQNINSVTLNNASLRLYELLHNLGTRKALKKPLAVCSLLSKISKNNENNNGILASMDIMAKSREKFKASENTAGNSTGGGMEIEHSNVGNVHVGMSTMLNQTHHQSKILKLVGESGNKGNPSINVTENDLLRDILYTFQGIDGNCIYYSISEEGFVIRPGVTLSSPVRKMVFQLCEMGWLYKKIIGFIGEANLDPRGLVHQSLCYALKEELNEYYRLIAVLENMKDSNINQGLTTDAFMGNQQNGQSSLNLRKLYLWSLESFERLKWMCVICDACRKVKGSVIISTIYGYAKQGAPSVQGLVNRVLKQVLAPFSHFLKQWVYHGELNDQYEEFFIKIDSYVKDHNLWYDKYMLNKEMVPAFMDIKIAESILTTGKSVNFLRKCCNYNDWVLEIQPIDLSSSMLVNVNQTLNFTEFEEWVSTANQATSRILLAVLLEKFRLVQHFETIKRFLLFGQGDFIQYLMDLLIKELSHPATSVYKHNLLSLLETAIRSSNAQHIQNEFLSRIDVKLLDSSPGDSGWDIFTLTYNLESPLTTIMNPKIMSGYLQVFNFLWRVKRIEHSMTSIWLQQMKGASMLNRIKEFRMYIHKCNILRNEMIHFIGNLFNYLMIEVIEGSWKIFMDELQEAKNLDEVIKYHEKFVNSILEKALLTPKSEKIYRQVVKLFDYIYRFKCTQEILLTSVQEEDQKRTSRKNKSEMMEILGDEYSEAASYDTERRGNDSIEVESAEKRATRSKITIEALNNLKNVWKDYKKSFVEFMELLKDARNDGKLRFLTFRLDFNEYYASMDPRHMEIRDRSIDTFRVNRSHDGYGDQDLYPSELAARPEPSSQARSYKEEQKMIVEDMGQRGTMQNISYDKGYASGSMRSEGRDMSFLKNLSYGDQFTDNRSILRSFNYGGLNRNDNGNA